LFSALILKHWYVLKVGPAFVFRHGKHLILWTTWIELFSEILHYALTIHFTKIHLN
jgi:hypothetical protein